MGRGNSEKPWGRRLGLRARTGLAIGGALIGGLSVPVTVLSTASPASAAVAMRHYSPTGATATLTGTGWSAPVAPGGGDGPGGGHGGGPKPDGTGWS